MIARSTASVIGESVLFSGALVAKSVMEGYEPIVVVWGKTTEAAVFTGFTVHTPLLPSDVSAILRKVADEIDQRAATLPREEFPLPQSEPSGGDAISDDSGSGGLPDGSDRTVP